ncbi:MAG: transporter substrate-binding domain-containing protein [Clostridiales bacterium]|nr:transporter substrate-binding domain-containing protein [Clostridiales bacterium]
MKKQLAFVLTAAMIAGCMSVPAAAEEEESKVWAIATDTVFKPFEYTNDDGEFVGIDVDILAAIAEDQGFEYELNSLGWDSAIAACQAGQADGMIAGASITDERKESGWTFSDGYYNATQSMTVAADSEITGFEDLAGLTVGVKTGTQGASYAESLQEEYGFEITYYEDSPTMYQAVLGGQVVACFEDTPIMAASIQDGDLALTILYDTENEGSPYGFAIFSEDSQELLDMFNAGLANIVENGTYAEIIATYLGEDAAATAEAAMLADDEAETEVETEAAEAETEAVTE